MYALCRNRALRLSLAFCATALLLGAVPASQLLNVQSELSFTLIIAANPGTGMVAACAQPLEGDADCDGLMDSADPCPGETLNRCVGPVAVCGVGVDQDCLSSLPLRLDLGNTAPQIDCRGETWNLDAGNGSDEGGTKNVNPSPIVKALTCTSNATEAIIQSGKAGRLVRRYPLPNGDYVVNLWFAEVNRSSCRVGDRTIDVDIEGQRFFGGPDSDDGLDIFAESLAQNGEKDACGGLVVRSAVVRVDDGVLDVALTEDGSYGSAEALLQAVEVLEVRSGGGSADLETEQVEFLRQGRLVTFEARVEGDGNQLALACIVDADCDDGNDCTDETCGADNLCVYSNNTLPCDDGNACTTGDECSGGSCVGGTQQVLSTDPSLYVHLRMEEPSGTRFDDSPQMDLNALPNDFNDMSAFNGPVSAVDDREGDFALDLVEGQQQYLQRPSGSLSPGFPGNPGSANRGLTLAGWVKAKSAGNHALVMKTADGNRSYSVWIWDFGDGSGPVIDPNIFDSDGNPGPGVDFRGTTRVYDPLLVEQEWFHFVYTYDGNTGVSRLYVNGVAEGTTDDPFNPEAGFTEGFAPDKRAFNGASADLEIGRRVGQFANYADVLLDEVLVFDRVLGASEALSLYQVGVIQDDTLCDDGVGCTVDSCDPVLGCSNAATDALCDNGLFCDGTETCDPVNDCQPGGTSALAFDGINDWVNIADLSFPGDFTLEAWVWLAPGIDNKDGIVGQEGSGQNINFHNSRMRLYAPGDVLVANTPAAASTWTHYAITRQGTSLTLYINGQQDATGTWSGAFVPKAIGRTGQGARTEGQMDEVRLWSVARSAAQIAANFDQAVSEMSPDLVGYWKFNESAGVQDVFDASGSGNDGSLGGTTAPSSDDPARVPSTAPVNESAACGGNTPPVANGDSATVASGGSVAIDVLDNDTDNVALDPSSVMIVDQPSNGTISNIDMISGIITYDHDGSASTSDTFTYTVRDNEGAISNVATVSLNILACTGSALAFDGVDDWVNIPDLSFPGDFTIEAWVLLAPGIDSQDGIVGQAGSGQNINFHNSRMRLYAPGDVLIATTPTAANTWTHYAITRQGSDLALYINGQQDATGTWSGVFAPKAIARTGKGAKTEGQMDQVRLWGIARSAAEIADDFDKTVSPTSPGLVGYWQFNENAGVQDVLDASSSGNDGSLGATTAVDSDDPARVDSTAPVDESAFCGGNAPPIANDDSATVDSGASTTIDVLFNDMDDVALDPSSVMVVSQPSTGTVANIDMVTGIITYEHNGTLTTSDSFTYTVDDDEGATSNTALVSITINLPPTVDCVVDADCDDGNDCTDETCGADNLCVYSNNTLPCDDGNACTTGDECSGGSCVGGTQQVLSTDPSLYVHLRMEEPSGTRFDDSPQMDLNALPNDFNDMSAFNGPVSAVDDREGDFALDLVEGQQQYLQRPSGSLSPGFPGNPGSANRGLTLAGWVKAKSAGNHALVMKTADGNRSYSVWIWDFGDGSGPVIDPNIFDSDGNPGPGVDFRGTTRVYDPLLVEQEWFHFVYTYDGNTGVSRLYVNGVAEGTTDDPFNPEAGFTEGFAPDKRAFNGASADLEIGRRVGQFANYADVLLDEVLVFDRVLGASEALSLYQVGVIQDDTLCDDGVGCTVDSCDPVLGCSNAATDALCDNGLFCDGTETCDPVNDCQPGGTSALAFDGLNDWVNIPDLSFPGDFTLEAWVLLAPGIDNKDGIVGQEGSGQNINFHNSRMRLYAPGDVLVANTPAAASTWTHYAITRQGTSLTLYINGQQDATGTWSGAFVPKAIGRTGQGARTEGQMDEVRLWSVARSAAQITANFDQAVSEMSPDLVGYWKFNESAGVQDVFDASGSGNDGSLGGTTGPSSDDPVRVPSTAPVNESAACGGNP